MLTLSLSLCFLSACSSEQGYKLESASEQVVIPGKVDMPFTDASLVYIDGDYSRVMSEMYRTCLATHWSMMTLEREPVDKRNVNPSVPDLVICTALMPNGLRSDIYIWRSENGKIAVALRAGPFGNRKKEKLFIKMLIANLAKEPVPDRSKRFDMPTLKQYQQAHEPTYE